MFGKKYSFEDDYDADFMREIDQIEQDSEVVPKEKNGAYYYCLISTASGNTKSIGIFLPKSIVLILFGSSP